MKTSIWALSFLWHSVASVIEKQREMIIQHNTVLWYHLIHLKEHCLQCAEIAPTIKQKNHKPIFNIACECAEIACYMHDKILTVDPLEPLDNFLIY